MRTLIAVSSVHCVSVDGSLQQHSEILSCISLRLHGNGLQVQIFQALLREERLPQDQMAQDISSLCLQSNTSFLILIEFFWYSQCVGVDVGANLVRRLDVYKSLDEVGPLDLCERRVEGVFALAGDDQTYQAGVEHRLVDHVTHTCSHKPTA